MSNSTQIFATVARRSLSCAIPLIAMLTHSVTAKPVARPRLQSMAHATQIPAAHIRDIMTIPIYMSSTSADGATVTVTVKVESVPTGGGTVTVGSDSSSTLVPPGGTWPYTLSFPSGSSTTGTFTLSVNHGGSSQVVTVYTYPDDASDPSDPSCWTQSVAVPVAAGSIAAKPGTLSLR